MISFRFHIVSIVAAFLALAVGIVIGTTALNGPVTSDLRSQVSALKSENQALSGKLSTLQTHASSADKFADAFSTTLVQHRLDEAKVLVVALPDTPLELQDRLTAELKAAGATVSGRLQLTSDYVDQSGASAITTLATSVQPAGTKLPNTSDARRLGAALLSTVLLGKSEPTDLTAVLSGLSGLHMINSDPKSIHSATTVLVVGSGARDDEAYAAQAEVDLVTALRSGGGHVLVAGDKDSAAETGVIGLLRSGSARTAVSTVDDASGSFGPASVVLALEYTRHKQVGHYGTGRGADATFPSPNG